MMNNEIASTNWVISTTERHRTTTKNVLNIYFAASVRYISTQY